MRPSSGGASPKRRCWRSDPRTPTTTIGPEHERNRRRHRPRNPGFARQPHDRGRRRARIGHQRPGSGSFGRVDRVEGSDRAARRRRRALRRQGRAEGRRERQHRNLRSDHRARRLRAGVHRSHDDRSRRHRQQGKARRQRDPRRLLRGGQGGGRGVDVAAVPLSGRRRRNGAAGAADERDQRRRAREQQHRHAGIHAGAARRADVSRGAALRRRGVPCAQEADRRQRHGDDGRRRGRIRAEPGIERGRAAAAARGDRQGRLHARHRHRAGARLRRVRILQGRDVRARIGRREAHPLADGRLSGGVGRQVSDHLDRGRHVRARLGRLEAA